ncbi:GIY-YIG nuclease family protein [bacterium]|nr:GIY-YIG nuclease family protein [bacterium]
MWHVYILKCNDSSFYTGIATDVQSRLHRHNSGRGSKYTRLRRPAELLYTEEFTNKAEAKDREKEIKKFSIDNKKRLIKLGMGHRFPSAQKI